MFLFYIIPRTILRLVRGAEALHTIAARTAFAAWLFPKAQEVFFTSELTARPFVMEQAQATQHFMANQPPMEPPIVTTRRTARRELMGTLTNIKYGPTT